MRHLRVILIVMSLPLTPSVLADSAAVVEGLQLPAWLERNGVRDSLTLGMSLQRQDTVETGPSARLLIQLEDGSLVKLGENASLTLAELEPAANSQGIFSSLLNVVRGAFRLTSAKLARQRRSNLEIKIASLTLGVRGTDVWGKAAIDRDIVCLIEGRIDVEDTINNAAFEMTQGLTFYIAPHGRPPLPVQPVPSAKLAEWSQETELVDGMGILQADGGWTVHLLSSPNRETADGTRQKLRKAGYAAQVRQVRLNGQTWYRVSIPGFVSKAEAQAFQAHITGKLGITQPWISWRES
jgi:hypothetical protein